MKIDITTAARAFGRMGGLANTESKIAASRANGALGGRPVRIVCDGKTVDVPQSVLAEITGIKAPAGSCGFRSGKIRFQFREMDYEGHVSIPHSLDIEDQEREFRIACAFTLIRQKALGGRPKTRFSPVFTLPDGEDFERNEDGDIVNDPTRWSGGWFPNEELATEVGIEYARCNHLVFVGVC